MKSLESILIAYAPLIKEYIESRARMTRIICWTVAYCATLVFAAWSIEATADGCDRGRLFGDWADLDGDGRNTREEMLADYDLGGFWWGEYSGVLIYQAGQVDIDHVIPLCLAVEWGAGAWPPEKRIAFANDPLNLKITHRSYNRSKGARPPSEWLPPNTTTWPRYIAITRALIYKYRLRPPVAELDALDCYERYTRQAGKGFRPGRFNCRDPT